MRNQRNTNFNEIENFIKLNDKSVLIPFSPAHLQDLKRSYFQSEKGKIETEKDLAYISTLTNDYCLYYRHKDKTVNPQRINPLKYFNEIYVDNDNLDPFDFENLFDLDDPLGKLWHSYIKILNLLPTGIDFSELDKLPHKYDEFKEIFSHSKVNNNFGNLMKDIMELLNDSEKFERIFKSIRETSNKDMKINTNTEEWGNPFLYLSKILQQNKIEKSFLSLTTDIIKDSNKKASRFDYFSNYYIQLDMFGYNKDNKISNLIDDASHSFYGAHCDIFVTDDRNTYRKSIALYSELNISTEVCNSTEFFTTVRKKKIYPPEETIEKQIIYFIKNSFILLDSVDDEFNPARIHKIEPYFKNFFNRMQISEYENETVLTFYKKHGNYSDFVFWIEMKNVIDIIVRELGTDQSNRSEFLNEEIEDVDNGNWTGRIWEFGDIIYELDYLKESFGLVFRLRLKTTGNNMHE